MQLPLERSASSSPRPPSQFSHPTTGLPLSLPSHIAIQPEAVFPTSYDFESLIELLCRNQVAAMGQQPTVELAKRFSRQRIDPLLEETPALRERVAPARARDSGNTMLSKEFPGGILVLTGANSAVGLRSMTARFLFLDEVDAYPGDVEGEGDPIALAEKRDPGAMERRLLRNHSPDSISHLPYIYESAPPIEASKHTKGLQTFGW